MLLSFLRREPVLCAAAAAALLSMACPEAGAQVTVVKDGRCTGRIVTPPGGQEAEAAALLKDFVQRISGAETGIVPAGSGEKKGDIIFKGTDPDSGLGEDGFMIKEENGKVTVTSGGGKGSVYAAVTILENCFGVRYYAADALDYGHRKTLVLPEGLDIRQTPTFRYRQTQSYSLKDPLYKTWHRLDEPADVHRRSSD